MHIRLDDLAGPEIRALLEAHLRHMYEVSPPESVHALDLDGLRRPEVRFWTAWSGAELLGCGALKELSPTHGEVKSMRTAAGHLRKGVARAMLEHIVREAMARGYERLSLETGSQPAFAPARALYAAHGFEPCAPFGDYVEDPNSVFMTRALEPVAITRAFAEAFAAEWIASWNARDLDRILSHYAQALEFASPFIASRYGEPSGRLLGKAAVRAYWADGLARQPGLRFRPRAVYLGVASVVLHYDRHDGRVGAEHFEFGADGKVVRASAHYADSTP